MEMHRDHLLYCVTPCAKIEVQYSGSGGPNSEDFEDIADLLHGITIFRNLGSGYEILNAKLEIERVVLAVG